MVIVGLTDIVNNAVGELETSAAGSEGDVGRFRGGRLEGLSDVGKHEGACVVGSMEGNAVEDGAEVG